MHPKGLRPLDPLDGTPLGTVIELGTALVWHGHDMRCHCDLGGGHTEPTRLASQFQRRPTRLGV